MAVEPRYPQPFTLAQLRELDVPTITKEITRLENSLKHLGYTQKELNDHLEEHAGDQEVSEAIKENQHVIAAQMERMSMLKLSLEERGINAISAHYIPNPSGETTTSDRPNTQDASVLAERLTVGMGRRVEENNHDGGVFL